MANVEFPEALFERVRTGNCILCTGVRFAAAAGMPAWDVLFNRMSNKLGGDTGALDQLLRDEKYLTVAGYLKRKLGPEVCSGILHEAFSEGGDPSPYKILKDLPFRATISTGYDSLVEETMAKNGVPPKVYTHADGAILRHSDDPQHFVLKAHGDVAHANRLVLDWLDYKRVINPNQAYRAFIEDLYRTNTLLILGYHTSDPDFILFLERFLANFRDAVTDHYALIPGLSEPEVEELYANYRIRALPYEEGSNPTESLTEALKQLRQEWRDRGTEVPSAEDPGQKIQWLRQQLVSVEIRIDVVAEEGLELSDARLESIRSSAESLDLTDVDPETLCRLGNVSLYFGDTARAKECYQAAMDLSPDMAEPHLNMHHAYAAEKEFESALDHLKKAMQFDSSLRSIPERYELTAVIGRGTTGTIYQAHDTEGKRDVTVKVLRTRYVREHVSPERWLKETEELELLDHPNLAKVHEAMLEGGRCILITENLNGRSLNSLMRESGPLSPENAVEILNQACEGLTYAHAQGILHLDITPSNIFLRDDGTVALMDFRTGRARKGRYITERGSEGYQAPELLAGAGGDARADIYSLGAVLYTMLTNRAPLGSFPRASEINPAARRFDLLISRALRAISDERPQTVEDFTKALTGSTEELTLPEREDDLDGWLEVLGYQPDHPQGREILRALEKQYRADKNWPELVALLLGRVEFEIEVETREHLLVEVAKIFEREEGDPAKAFAALQAAFRENNSSVEIRKDLERLAGAANMWNELLQEYTQIVQSLRDPKLAGDWWVRMGSLYSNKLGHDDYAMASFNQALTLDANRLDALSELSEVLKRKGMIAEQIQVLERLADLEDDPVRKVELLAELGQIQRGEGNHAAAIAAHEKLLAVDPGHAAAATAMEELYTEAEQWEELARFLNARIEASEVADEMETYRHHLANILADKLNRPEEAIAQYQALMAANPDDVGALKGLERLFDATGRNQEYLEILDKRIGAAESTEEQIALYKRMSSEWESQPDGKAKAAEHLEKVVELTGGDEESFTGLVRFYWELKDYARLADAYRRNIKLQSSPADRAGLYAALGKVYEDHLSDMEQAAEAFNNLLGIEEGNKIALSALARIYEKLGVWAQAVQMLQILATKEESVDQQVEIFYQIGVLQHTNLKNDDDAEVSFVKALELKDDHTETLMALSEMYRERKDFGKAARMLREAARHTVNELEKIKRMHLAGITYQDDLGNEEQALEIYEELFRIDPEHVPTGERLAAIYRTQERYEEAELILEMLVRKSDNRERGKLLELNLGLGDMAQACRHDDKAVAAYRTAYDIDPTYHPTLQRLANLLLSLKEFNEAGKLFQSLLVHRREAMEQGEIVDVFCKLGQIKEQLGEESKALNMYEKALDLDPASPEVLSRAIQLYKNKGDLESVLKCKKSQLKSAKEQEEIIAIAEEIGDLLNEEIDRPMEAVTFYQQVIAAQPDNRRVLNKVMEIYIIQKKWNDAITTMGKIEDYETNPEHRARLHYTAAVILRDELNNPKEAAYHLDQALIKDPTHRKAFDAIKTLYTKQRNFKGLVKAYRLMLQRLPEETPKAEQVQLWLELGEICQTKVQDAKGAIVAYEVATRLDPSNMKRQQNLAQLYTAAGPDAYDKAIAAHNRLLMNNPSQLHAYRELFQLYGKMGQLDRQWCVAAVLAALRKASDEELALYNERRPEQPRNVSRKLSDDLWSDDLYHKQQDPTLNLLFAATAGVIAPMAARSRSSWGLRDSERLDPGNDSRPFALVSDYLAQVLDTSVSEMFIRGDLKQQLELGLAGDDGEMSTVLMVNPSIIKNESLRELRYWFTKAYAMLRPEHFLRFATPSATVLRAVVLASLKLVQPATKLSGDVDEILRLVEVLRNNLAPSHFERLTERADTLRLLAKGDAVERWMEGVNLSVSRAALLLCDDFETAARMLALEPSEPGVDPKARLQELMAYSVSEPFFKLREQVGLQIK